MYDSLVTDARIAFRYDNQLIESIIFIIRVGGASFVFLQGLLIKKPNQILFTLYSIDYT